MSTLVLDKGVRSLHTFEVPDVGRDAGRVCCSCTHDEGDHQGCRARYATLTARDGVRKGRVGEVR